jgi:hypothetical protein
MSLMRPIGESEKLGRIVMPKNRSFSSKLSGMRNTFMKVVLNLVLGTLAPVTASTNGKSSGYSTNTLCIGNMCLNIGPAYFMVVQV